MNEGSSENYFISGMKIKGKSLSANKLHLMFNIFVWNGRCWSKNNFIKSTLKLGENATSPVH